jgi:16S rRNA (guanine966-N2)-methyltransferase
LTRIIGGEARGRRLRTPNGERTRPTADRVREALFSAIEARLGGMEGLRFLDVYAGSGAVGLEARSRGAAHVGLVEQDRATARLSEVNARTLGFDDVTLLTVRADRLGGTPPDGGGYDVVFLDPPYDVPADEVAGVLQQLRASGWLTDESLVVVERRSRGSSWQWPEGFEAVQSRRYGETMLWYGRLALPLD